MATRTWSPSGPSALPFSPEPCGGARAGGCISYMVASLKDRELMDMAVWADAALQAVARMKAMKLILDEIRAQSSDKEMRLILDEVAEEMLKEMEDKLKEMSVFG